MTEIMPVFERLAHLLAHGAVFALERKQDGHFTAVDGYGVDALQGVVRGPFVGAASGGLTERLLCM